MTHATADEFCRKRPTRPIRVLINESTDESKPWKTVQGEIVDIWEGNQK